MNNSYLNNFLFKAQGKILRFLGSKLGYRPTSFPFISGDGFRTMADHIFDETKKCKANSIKENDIVFVNSDMIDEWFNTIHTDIHTKYKLITHNSDTIVNESKTHYIDDKIIVWYAQNNTFKHNKIVPIPIGIENIKWFMSGWYLLKDYKKLKRNLVQKKNRILYGFNVNTNPRERTTALESLKKSTAADPIQNRIEPRKYFRTLNEYKFVASPEGNGVDCHRTWEAIILGTVPIIRNTSHNQLLINQKLPIFLIDNWNELTKLTENELAMIYNNYAGKDLPNIIMLDYWKKIIIGKI